MNKIQLFAARSIWHRLFVAVAIATANFNFTAAHAAWPERTITIIVPFPAGGPNDLLGRLLAAELSPKLGQNVIVENRVGAVGNIGLTAGAVAYDPIKDFVPIAYLGAAPNAIIARPASGITSIADLIAKAKANPGKLTYASPGLGSVSQLAVELLKLRVNIDMTHVPFSGAAPALQAALSGTTDIASVSIAGLISHIRSGTLKALAQTGGEHWVDMPDVPTMQEAGVPNAVVETSQMFLAPAGTPPEVIKRLSGETRLILQKPEIKDKMLTAGFMVKYEGPEELHARMLREVPVWKEIVERAGLAKGN